MYKLIITSTDGGVLLLSGAGSDEPGLLKYSEDWVTTHGHSKTTATVSITSMQSQTAAAGYQTKSRYSQKHVPQMQLIQKPAPQMRIVHKHSSQMKIVPKQMITKQIIQEPVILELVLQNKIFEAAEIYN
jgi:hypothetical protein